MSAHPLPGIILPHHVAERLKHEVGGLLREHLMHDAHPEGLVEFLREGPLVVLPLRIPVSSLAGSVILGGLAAKTAWRMVHDMFRGGGFGGHHASSPWLSSNTLTD